jgi:hypothetical protein
MRILGGELTYTDGSTEDVGTRFVATFRKAS